MRAVAALALLSLTGCASIFPATTRTVEQPASWEEFWLAVAADVDVLIQNGAGLLALMGF